MKEFRKELDLNLTKDQLSRLKAMDDRRQEMIRQNRRNHENDTLYNRQERRHLQGRPPNFRESDSIKLPDNK
jgi:hypothetical protein